MFIDLIHINVFILGYKFTICLYSVVYSVIQTTNITQIVYTINKIIIYIEIVYRTIVARYGIKMEYSELDDHTQANTHACMNA